MTEVATRGSPAVPFRVLVVDDDPGMLDLMDDPLSLGGYTVLRATSGEAALDAAAAQAPRAAFVDLVLSFSHILAALGEICG